MLLFFAPLVIGALIGVAVANTWLTALEDRERERREAERDARHTELRWMVWDTAVHGPVIETVYDGGATVNMRN